MRYSEYPKNWFTKIRPAVFKRDKYTCRHCGAKKGQVKHSFTTNKTYIVSLCVAHLDHDKENHKVKLSRLKTLCQSCHLIYDNATDPKRFAKRNKAQRKGKSEKVIKKKPLTSKEKRYYYWGELKRAPKRKDWPLYAPGFLSMKGRASAC